MTEKPKISFMFLSLWDLGYKLMKQESDIQHFEILFKTDN